MSAQFDSIRDAYEKLSSLYKNPTRHKNSPVDGVAAQDVNHELTRRYKSLRNLLRVDQNDFRQTDEALYFSTFALLYEVAQYFGGAPELGEGRTEIIKGLFEQFAHGEEQDWNLTRPKTRSEIKAKIRCCVAAVELRRRQANLEVLKGELNILERFIKDNLHRPEKPAWTTLAFVQSAQARLARQTQDYEQCQRKLIDEVNCLNNRAEEIVDRLKDPTLSEVEIEDLKDDLVFIRRKQTLSNFFNVGLAAFQRGFLRSARQACEAARMQFRLHGLSFHEVFNDLIILSIKRGRTSRGQKDKFKDLKRELEENIIPRLNGAKGVPNPKLHLYSLRELAVLQYYCDENSTDDMLKTLEEMDDHIKRHGPFSSQWQSRVSIQRARALWRNWAHHPDTPQPEAALQKAAFQKAAFQNAQKAFTAASNLKEEISSYHDARELRTAIERSENISLIDTIESLVTYGTFQASAKQFAEAIKSASVVIQLSGDDNPRLCAMGYLVRAEAYAESDQIREAQQDVVHACEREARIDHRYVGDRRRHVVWAIERHLPQPSLFLGDMNAKDYKKKGRNRLLGWFIETKTDKKNKSEIEDKLRIHPDTLNRYLEYLKKNESDPYYYLIGILSKRDEEPGADDR